MPSPALIGQLAATPRSQGLYKTLLHHHPGSTQSKRCPHRRSALCVASLTVDAASTAVADPDVTYSQPGPSGRDRSHTTDYFVIGSGIGGEATHLGLHVPHKSSLLMHVKSVSSHLVRHDPHRMIKRSEVIIAGLCCAALLAKYGYRVTVCESHYHAGGAAHSFEVQGYQFDAGPSFFAGLSGKAGGSPNPLKQVLDAVGESVDCAVYDRVSPNPPMILFICSANFAPTKY